MFHDNYILIHLQFSRKTIFLEDFGCDRCFTLNKWPKFPPKKSRLGTEKTLYLVALVISRNLEVLVPRMCQEFGKWLVKVGYNPSEKYDRQNRNLPQVGMKIKNI